jgi:hypothetical protein
LGGEPERVESVQALGEHFDVLVGTGDRGERGDAGSGVGAVGDVQLGGVNRFGVADGGWREGQAAGRDGLEQPLSHVPQRSRSLRRR